jgi:hypothetical protein
MTPTASARTLLKGGLAFLVVPAVLVLVIGLSPFGSEPPASAIPWTRLGSSSDRSIVAALDIAACGDPWVRPAEVDYEPDRIVVTIRVDDDVRRIGGGADIIRCTAEVELDEPISGRPILDGSCLEPEERNVPFCAGGAQRWPRA